MRVSNQSALLVVAALASASALSAPAPARAETPGAPAKPQFSCDAHLRSPATQREIEAYLAESELHRNVRVTVGMTGPLAIVSGISGFYAADFGHSPYRPHQIGGALGLMAVGVGTVLYSYSGPTITGDDAEKECVQAEITRRRAVASAGTGAPVRGAGAAAISASSRKSLDAVAAEDATAPDSALAPAASPIR